MRLTDKQFLFAQTMSRFQVWLAVECGYRGLTYSIAEVFRPVWVAEHYAERGIGIKTSVHTKKLAHDLFLFRGGKFLTDPSEYEFMGARWRPMHELARWGGDFRNRDAVHFSFEHNGVM